MSHQDSLLSRLRRLIDDAGHGFSQSAPGWIQNIRSTGISSPHLGVKLDAYPAVDANLGSILYLETGGAIAIAIQNVVRALDPDPEGSAAFQGFSARFNQEEGFLLRSGTQGSNSEVHVLPTAAGDDVSEALRLGAHVGGFESTPSLRYTDDELRAFLDEGLAEQNKVGDLTAWTYATLPTEYETVVTYRAWGSVLDIMLGEAAYFYPQKVAGEEVAPNRIFENLFKLRKWLDDKIEDLTQDLESQIQVTNLTRYDSFTGTYVGDPAYEPNRNQPFVQAAVEGDSNTEIIVELGEILTLDIKKVYLAYSTDPGVFDPTLLNEENFDLRSLDAALSTGSVLAKTLNQTKHPMVRVTGLTPGETYYVAAQLVDQNGNYYFSNEVSVTLSL